ncbi:MAG: hypothetical protein JNJ90_09515 [Saprospiraceae bacterium]|jgi:hypothetical protein|nr:hypothetical protein [Saprospiraceae bacterium]
MKRATHFVRKNPILTRLASLVLLLNGANLPAQDLQIYYDLFTDSITYKKDGQTVLKPKIRKGDFVVLHFTEFNPYLYNAEVDIEQSNAEGWSGAASSGAAGAGAAGFMAPLMGAAGAAPGGGGLLSSFLDMPLISMGQNSLKLADLFGNSRGAEKQLLADARTHLEALANVQDQMVEIYEEIQTMERSERAAQLASKHLDQLLMNPRMKPSMIRRIAAEYHALIFPDKPVNELQVLDAFEWQDRFKVKRGLMHDLQNKQREFDLYLAGLAPITRQLSDLDIKNQALDEFSADLRRLNGKGADLRQKLEAYIAGQSVETKMLSMDEMLALQMKFRELADQPFDYQVAISVEKSTVVVTARFAPLDSVLTTLADKKAGAKTKTVKLETQGGLRISTGVGIGFGRMFDPVEEFSVRENAIVAEEGGIVQPSLATFIHFYPHNSRSGMALAGTFGIGIPLSLSNITALNFYLGPSLMFGRGQRIVLSGGITAGPIKKLGKGFKVGDPFDPNLGDIPTRTAYDLGYFLSISFNVGG